MTCRWLALINAVSRADHGPALGSLGQRHVHDGGFGKS
jgi:hypothetical protein